jgi:hypothetical protein
LQVDGDRNAVSQQLLLPCIIQAWLQNSQVDGTHDPVLEEPLLCVIAHSLHTTSS